MILQQLLIAAQSPANSCVPINKYIKRDRNRVGAMAQPLKGRFTIKKIQEIRKYLWTISEIPAFQSLLQGRLRLLPLGVPSLVTSLSVTAQRHRILYVPVTGGNAAILVENQADKRT